MVSDCFMGLERANLKFPCVPRGSVMWHVRPSFVWSCAGLKYWTSSGFSNMRWTTALRLCVRSGKPVSTARLRTMRVGSQSSSDPVATTSPVAGRVSATGAGAKVSGPSTEHTTCPPARRNRSYLARAPRGACAEYTGRARQRRWPHDTSTSSLDGSGGDSPSPPPSDARRTRKCNTVRRFSWRSDCATPAPGAVANVWQAAAIAAEDAVVSSRRRTYAPTGAAPGAAASSNALRRSASRLASSWTKP
mmetsp:Transcript_9243/g.28861  ORF Transcript_9243/g.28861 Transcript_9243/m.28861 type:complete len:248 (-) Transcript_9243:591-1334(-)